MNSKVLFQDPLVFFCVEFCGYLPHFFSHLLLKLLFCPPRVDPRATLPLPGTSSSASGRGPASSVCLSFLISCDFQRAGVGSLFWSPQLSRQDTAVTTNTKQVGSWEGFSGKTQKIQNEGGEDF